MNKLTLKSQNDEISPAPLSCLDGCECDDPRETSHDLVIRCDNGTRTELDIPRTPLKGYHFIALTCNNIKNLPSAQIIKAAFPDLQGIDVQGNPEFDCSSLVSFEDHLPILSDCDGEQPTQCDAKAFQDCDWSCRALSKLKELWAKFKEQFNTKMKQIGADKAAEDIKSWFSDKFDKLGKAFDNLTN
ncbi:hypothetical protein WR25_04550 [Diploscapter pachys]|uniref:Uncharacterized protein n=1 Tax=Diploscapter pachys TaxID=2018661 RepID=A0A2A2LG08_9BILA|nr:hypothetical protein WR25_04550 [Diploscapter pachys]